ncbi:MAG: hypothetical protein JWM93_178, partial [Frankiales bacterium]|nr:hypothetical protein [Frankiales bacterium]
PTTDDQEWGTWAGRRWQLVGKATRARL